MASILDSLNIAKLSLSAQQYAMNVSQRNTVNVNNPNYTRQEVLFSDLTMPGNWSAFGVPGVELSAARNRYLDQSIGYELPALGENLVKYNALREIDSVLQGTSGGGLIKSINAFFNSFTELSSDPTDSALRWQVLSTAETMTQDFKRIYEEIQRVQNAAERHIVSGVEDVNKLTAKIADLNGRIEAAHNTGQLETEYALRDERQQCIEELEGKIGLLYFETESGSITVTTANGNALVLGKTSSNLSLGSMPGSSFSGIYFGSISNPNNNITASVTSGEIGGYLQVRDTLIPEYLKKLDDMAAGIIDAVNTAHAAGEDLNGNPGGVFFTSTPLALPPPSNPNAGTARTMSVVITDPDEIAAAGTGMGIGDNGNAKKLAEIGVKGLFGAGTPTVGEMYSSLIYKVGSDQRNAQETGNNQQNLIRQLLAQRNSESGVSLNEEAINLIKYQQAYQASSRIVSVLNILSAEVLNFVGV